MCVCAYECVRVCLKGGGKGKDGTLINWHIDLRVRLGGVKVRKVVVQERWRQAPGPARMTNTFCSGSVNATKMLTANENIKVLQYKSCLSTNKCCRPRLLLFLFCYFYVSRLFQQKTVSYKRCFEFEPFRFWMNCSIQKTREMYISKKRVWAC